VDQAGHLRTAPTTRSSGRRRGWSAGRRRMNRRKRSHSEHPLRVAGPVLVAAELVGGHLELWGLPGGQGQAARVLALPALAARLPELAAQVLGQDRDAPSLLEQQARVVWAVHPAEGSA
jgi:hypothetical protein